MARVALERTEETCRATVLSQANVRTVVSHCESIAQDLGVGGGGSCKQWRTNWPELLLSTRARARAARKKVSAFAGSEIGWIRLP